MKLAIENVRKEYRDGTVALDDVDIAVAPERITAIVGPSGSGKSTLLNIVAGLQQPTAGRVLFSDRDVTRIPPERRNVGYVFQSYALFPHMTVEENISFGLMNVAREHRRSRVDALASLFRLAHLLPRLPRMLSGGEKQRVAVARALAPEPQLLLLDEPLSAIDAQLREELREELSTRLRQFGQTTIYVTHDRHEAMQLADDIVVLRAGRVMQVGTPAEIYERPHDAFVARFFGSANLVSGSLDDSGRTVETGYGRFDVAPQGALPDNRVLAIVRPEMFSVDATAQLRLVVERATYFGSHVELAGTTPDGDRLVAHVSPSIRVAKGDSIPLAITPMSLHVIAAEKEST